MSKKETEIKTDEQKNSGQQDKGAQSRRGVSSPNDVASMILMQVDAVNSKKDDLTIAIKGLTDLTKQLTRAYAEHTRTIRKLAERVKELEEK